MRKSQQLQPSCDSHTLPSIREFYCDRSTQILGPLKIKLQQGTIDNTMSALEPRHMDNNYVIFPAGLRGFFFFSYHCKIVTFSPNFFFYCTSFLQNHCPIQNMYYIHQLNCHILYAFYSFLIIIELFS